MSYTLKLQSIANLKSFSKVFPVIFPSSYFINGRNYLSLLQHFKTILNFQNCIYRMKNIEQRLRQYEFELPRSYQYICYFTSTELVGKQIFMLQQNMIKKKQDCFSICEISTSQASLQISRCFSNAKMEKEALVEKLKNLQGTLLEAKQENLQLKMNQENLLEDLQMKKMFLTRMNDQLFVKDRNARVQKGMQKKDIGSSSITHLASKWAIPTESKLKPQNRYKYSQRFCTVMNSPLRQSPQKQESHRCRTFLSPKSSPLTLLLEKKQPTHGKLSHQQYHKIQRKMNYNASTRVVTQADSIAIACLTIEDIWNEQSSGSSLKYCKSSAKTIVH